VVVKVVEAQEVVPGPPGPGMVVAAARPREVVLVDPLIITASTPTKTKHKKI